MHIQRTLTRQRIGAAAGIAAPVLAFVCILVAVASHSEFSWTNNALSDLGIVPGITGPLFNFGLYASGFLGIDFAVFGLFAYLKKSVVGRAGAIVFAGAAFALIAIGVFNESFSGIHFGVSVAFFVLAPVSLFILTGAFVLAQQVRTAVFTIVIAIIASLPWILRFVYAYVPNVAIPETVSGVAVSAWTIVISFKIIKHLDAKV